MEDEWVGGQVKKEITADQWMGGCLGGQKAGRDE